MKNKILSLLLVMLCICGYSQTPVFLGSTSFSATGSGTSGVPGITYNIPSGNNRVLMVSLYIERNHGTVGNSNWPADADGTPNPSPNPLTQIKIAVGSTNITQLDGRYSTFEGPTGVNNIRFSTHYVVGYFTDAQGLPTGNTTITFPNLNLPENAGDEMVVVVSVYGDANQNAPLNLGSTRELASSVQSITHNATPNPTVPAGTSLSNVQYLVNSYTSDQHTATIAVPASWTGNTNVRLTNTNGTSIPTASPTADFINENDGIRFMQIRRSAYTAATPSVTVNRASNDVINRFAVHMYAILPLARPSITGTVYRDNNGNATIDGGGTGGGVWNSSVNGTLYVNAVNSLGNVVAVATVDNAGVFTFPSGGNLIEGNAIKFQLSKNQGVVGQPAPVKELFSGWATVGESTTGGTSDGNPNGEFSLNIGTTDSPYNTTNRFGITASVDAVDDIFNPVVAGSTTLNIAANDKNIAGAAAVIGNTAGQVSVSQSGSWPAGFTLNTTTGAINIASSVTPGVYTMNYLLCNQTAGSPCDTATVTITVKFTTVSDVACSNNGTFEDATDDYVIFQIDPVAPVNYVEGTYQYNLTASFAGSPVTVTQIDGSAATNLYYSTPAYFKIPTSGLGTGNFTVTLTPTWGSYTPKTVSFANPGTCSVACTSSSTGNVVTYYFKAPEYTTDFNNASTNVIPKFNEGTTRKLTKVKVDYGVAFTGGLLIEAQNPMPSYIKYRTYSDLTFNIAGHTYNTTFDIGKNPSYPLNDPFLVGQSSPAVAAWPGTGPDTYAMTVMLSNPNTNWLRTTVGLGMDPKANPNWVTNLSGIESYDDDILQRIYDNVPYNASVTFTNATDLGNFTGTGSLPNSFTTAANVEATSGSSLVTFQRLRASYYYKVEYTYDCIVDPCTISATNPDSDGDGISDFCDVDDDNDGILDTEECKTNTLSTMLSAFGAGTLLSISPSDFGLPLNARNQNVSKDLSAKFGYPANSGAVIVSITNASVHPSVDVWWTKAGQQPSNWKVTGKMSAYVLMAQDNANFYANDSKTIHIYDGAPVVPVNIGPFGNQTPIAGQWAVSETATAKTLTNLNTDNSTVESAAGWRYANVSFGAKSFGFSTTVASADPTYEVRMVLECDTDGDGIPDRLDLDSDADNCSDALEGVADVRYGQLTTAGGTLTGGSTTVNLNICTTCASATGSNAGLPQFSTLPTAYSNTTGQGVGNAQNALENKCYCTKPATPGIPDGYTKVGITIQQKQEAWPENIPNGHIALESKTKGLVITRVAHVSFVPDLINDAVKNPSAGMLVYDIQDKCVKLFNGINWKCLERSCNTASN